MGLKKCVILLFAHTCSGVEEVCDFSVAVASEFHFHLSSQRLNGDEIFQINFPFVCETLPPLLDKRFIVFCACITFGVL